MTALFRVAVITAAETHPLRLAVLRNGTPTTDVDFDGDAEPDTMHLGVRDAADNLIAVSTWVPRVLGDRPGIQLRGMATAAHLQGGGVGGLLLEDGCRRCFDLGAPLVWARARDTALRFYVRHNFTVEGDGFVEATTQIAHHVVVRSMG